MSNVTVSTKSTLSKISRLPWMLLVIAYLIAMQILGISMLGTAGYIFIVLALVVLFIEIFKSGDVGSGAFLLDQFWAILAVILATGLMTYLWIAQDQAPTFYHWIGFAMIVADALLSPFNAYRTALRNFDVPS